MVSFFIIILFFNCILLVLFIIFLSLLMELTGLCYLREKSFSLAQFVFDHAFPQPQLFMSFSHCFLCLTGFLQLWGCWDDCFSVTKKIIQYYHS